MQKAFDKIKELMARNATHRKGFRIADQTPGFHLKYAAGEILELSGALHNVLLLQSSTMAAMANVSEGSRATLNFAEDDVLQEELREFADVMNCLQIYAIKRGWTEEQIDAAQMEKLETRFDKEESRHEGK